MNKIKIAVSACLLGQNVRYDGGNKFIDLEKYFKPNVYEFKAICPEVEMGMSIPRAAIQINRDNGIKLVQVDKPENDFTKQMENWFTKNIERLQQYAGFILKSKSPSCGYATTPHFSESKSTLIADGLFVSLLMKKFNNPNIIDEINLSNQQFLKKFISSLDQLS